jgi:hypothetical protein
MLLGTNAIDFCILTLCLAAFTIHLLVLGLLVDFPGFSPLMIMLYVNKGILCILFFNACSSLNL